MDSITRTTTSGSVFEASTKDPQAAVACSVAEVAKLLAKYKASQDILDRMTLLTEVEALRRFVLVRSALLRALRGPGATDDLSIGQELCNVLRGMVAEQPDLVKSCSLQGARNMERDSRRAVASLTFIGSLDPSFV